MKEIFRLISTGFYFLFSKIRKNFVGSVLLIGILFLLIQLISVMWERAAKVKIPRETAYEWTVEISYRDKGKDTLVYTSSCYPQMNIRNGVSIFHTCWGSPMASYVKTFKILKQTEKTP